MQRISPCLWFDSEAEEAARHYISIFPDSRLVSVTHYPQGAPRPAGSVMQVTFDLAGLRFSALNGGPVFTFNEAVSLAVGCETQDEIDRLYDRLAAGGAIVQCGWLKDKYGLSWQLIPAAMERMMKEGTGAQLGRMMAALMAMKRIDIAALQAAFEGR